MPNHSEAVVDRLPNCDWHPARGMPDTRPAVVDAKTTQGPWAYLCQECWEEIGCRDEAGQLRLGLGWGQRLVVRNLKVVKP